jgi:hypothetical protein
MSASDCPVSTRPLLEEKIKKRKDDVLVGAVDVGDYPAFPGLSHRVASC